MPTFNLPPRFQFSLRGMLIAVAVVALVLGLGAVAGGLLIWLLTALVIWLLPTPLVVAAIYGRGDLRAFSIGALVPWASFWASGPAASSLVAIVDSTLWLLFMGGLCGFVAVATRRWIETADNR
jgi:hypothetical protein